MAWCSSLFFLVALFAPGVSTDSVDSFDVVSDTIDRLDGARLLSDADDGSDAPDDADDGSDAANVSAMEAEVEVACNTSSPSFDEAKCDEAKSDVASAECENAKAQATAACSTEPVNATLCSMLQEAAGEAAQTAKSALVNQTTGAYSLKLKAEKSACDESADDFSKSNCDRARAETEEAGKAALEAIDAASLRDRIAAAEVLKKATEDAIERRDALYTALQMAVEQQQAVIQGEDSLTGDSIGISELAAFGTMKAEQGVNFSLIAALVCGALLGLILAVVTVRRSQSGARSDGFTSDLVDPLEEGVE